MMNNLQQINIEKNNNKAGKIVDELLSTTIKTENEIHEWFGIWAKTILSFGTHISKCCGAFLTKGRGIKNSEFPWNKNIAREFGRVLKMLKRIEILIDTHEVDVNPDVDTHDYLAFGNMFEGTDALKTSEVFENINIKKIICGCVHVIIITTEGHVYTWGNDDYDRLGHDGDGKFPERIESLENIVDGAAGYSHSFVIDSSGRLWGWGCANDGRLGIQLPDYDIAINRPRLITVPSPFWNSDGCEEEEEVLFKSVMTGSTFTIALSMDNQLYTWGRRGLNGITNNSDIYIPTKILPELYFREISTGSDGWHILALSMAGHVYAWGLNHSGQLGTPVVSNNFQENFTPLELKLKNQNLITSPRVMDFSKDHIVVTMRVGMAHSIFLLNDGTVLTCGRNMCGQLGVDPVGCDITTNGYAYRYQPRRIEGLRNIVQIGSGGQHSVGVDSDGHVWTWGINNMHRTRIPSLNILGRNLADDISHVPMMIPELVSLTNIKPIIGYECNFIPI